MPLNLIIKKERNPHWRLGQEIGKRFPSLDKSGKDRILVDKHPKESFSPEVMRRIEMAAIKTNAMKIDFQREENKELRQEAERVAGLIIKPAFKSVI
jgi:hypothetical protein